MSNQVGWTAVLSLVAALAGSCNMSVRLGPTHGVWAINESTNDYIVQVSEGGGELATALGEWALPSRASGFVGQVDAVWVRVLDARTCSMVDAELLSPNTLVTVDARGRVEFVAEPDTPRMDVELSSSTKCNPPMPPPGETTS